VSDRLSELVAEAKASAAQIDHPWDMRAIDWPDLTPDSVVAEVGGYKGRWALQIAERYRPRLFVFEPQTWAAEVCRAALGDAATVLNYGLGVEDVEHGMGEWETDGCSFVKSSTVGPVHFGLIREIGAAFNRLGITTVDLLLMNIEGYEYMLLPHMLDHGILPRRLMVQFHGSDADTTAMFDRLAAAGYTVLWTYGQVLTAWER
jgi:FkbM family methyltransferase